MPEPLFDAPMPWFDAWFDEAASTGITDPNAMTLSTVDASGMPSSRIVLLKEHDARGFVFYTNLESAKGRQLLETRVASLLFFWPDMGRQIRISGTIERVSDAQADAYFASRPRTSRIGAWASAQSRPLASRQVLIDRVAELELEYKDADIPRPPHWSGIRVIPQYIEFWQAGDFRLHDRFVFTSAGNGWSIARLNP